MNTLLKNLIPFGLVEKRREQIAESRQTNLYRSIIEEGSLVFDVGANIGNRINALLNCRARVIAIEPQPECVMKLRAKYGEKITIVEAALGSEKAKLNLHVSAKCDTVATLSREFIASANESKRFGDREWGNIIPVDVLTLDSIIEEWGTPSFMKIDVEGFELEVLRGLSKSVRALSFEWTSNRPDASRKCIDYLCGIGMPYFQISFGESMSLGHRTSQGADVIKNLLSLLGDEMTCFGDIYASMEPIKRR